MIKSSLIKITPEIAKDYLKNNNHNRPISDHTVTKYSNDMKDGNWHTNGAPIILSNKGQVIDGQHRLSAIVRSGVAIETLLVEGVDPSAFKTVDIGKKRTGADALATFDKKYRKDGALLAAAVSIITQFTSHGVFKEELRNKKPNHSELIKYVENNKGLLRSCDFAKGLQGAKKFVPLSCLVALHFLFSKKDINKCEDFFFKLNTGENLTKGDPVLVLRNRLVEIRHSGGVFRTREIMPYVLKAWEAVREDRQIERLRIDVDYVPVIL